MYRIIISIKFIKNMSGGHELSHLDTASELSVRSRLDSLSKGLCNCYQIVLKVGKLFLITKGWWFIRLAATIIYEVDSLIRHDTDKYFGCYVSLTYMENIIGKTAKFPRFKSPA